MTTFNTFSVSPHPKVFQTTTVLYCWKINMPCFINVFERLVSDLPSLLCTFCCLKTGSFGFSQYRKVGDFGHACAPVPKVKNFSDRGLSNRRYASAAAHIIVALTHLRYALTHYMYMRKTGKIRKLETVCKMRKKRNCEVCMQIKCENFRTATFTFYIYEFRISQFYILPTAGTKRTSTELQVATTSAELSK